MRTAGGFFVCLRRERKRRGVKTMSQNKKMVEAITPINEDFAQWYTDVVKKAELCDYASVKGCMVIKPAGYAIWENIMHLLDARFKATGHENVAMPLFIPESLLQKEKDHVEGFAPEVAWVTMGGSEPLEDRLCVRPTSETLRTLCQHHPLLAGPAQAVQPVVQRGALGKNHAPLPAHAGILVAGGPYHPRNRAGGHRGDRAAAGDLR
jgi:hypothetical protein